jgi:glutathione S-transferase
MMKLTAWITIASLLMYIWVFTRVGRARGVHKVAAPATDGPIEFLISSRVQTNTVEQLILFLPLLWLCGMYLSDLIASILGAVWVIGRIIYALGYYRAPEKRHIGFVISSLAGLGLLIGAVVGLVSY